MGWFCLGYASVGIFALFLPRIFAAALLFVVIAADLIGAVSKTYYLPPSECLENLAALRDFSGPRVIALITVAALALAVSTVAAVFPVTTIKRVYREHVAICLMGFIVCAVSIDYVTIVRQAGHLPSPFELRRPDDIDRFSDYRNLWVARYTALRLFRDEKMFGVKRDVMNAAQLDRSAMRSATAQAIPLLGLGTRKRSAEQFNLVVVLVESWGLGSDPKVQRSIVHPYDQADLLARYSISYGTVPFNGGTVAGEARELCGSKMGIEIMNAPEEVLRGCLPARLASLGYHTVSLHGMTGQIFSRSSWYKPIGFQEQWFKDGLRREGLPDCAGAFDGICDSSIGEWIERRLGNAMANPEFIYWVTLNSHLPVPVPSGLPTAVSCTFASSLTQDPALCSWYQLVYNVHDSISKIAVGRLARPTIFVVVGDHAPPFAKPELRSQFSNAGVPYVILVPRRNSDAAKR